MAYGVIAWGSKWISGYQEIAIFAFVLCGAILGFLVFNTHPAKVFMGDTGSLALGGALATIAILTKHELSLLLIGGVFVVETLSSAIQIIAREPVSPINTLAGCVLNTKKPKIAPHKTNANIAIS